MEILTGLDRRIAAAMQVDPRASWRKIASVLGEPERSVARRGSDLIDSGAVQVRGLRLQSAAAVLWIECSPGAARVAAESLAQRRDTTFSYVVSGRADCIAEIITSVPELGRVLADEIPATTGAARIITYPVMQHFRTIRGWHAPGLTDAEASALETPLTGDRHLVGQLPEIQDADLGIIEALVEDGRAPVEAIARRVGVSESTVARRVESLIRACAVQVRAIVEPWTVGLAVEGLLWISVAPAAVERVGTALAARPEVRYAAAVAGPYQIVADVTVGAMGDLYQFMTDALWAQDTREIDTSLVLMARKRGGLLMPAAHQSQG